MTQLGREIVKVATDWLDFCRHKGACETSQNWGGCYTDIQNAFGPGGKRQATCAKFGWLCVNQACKNLGIKNTLPKDPGALHLRDRAAKVMPVNVTPAIGSLFYHISTAKGSSGHIGVVTELTATGIKTIEANHGNCLVNPAFSDGMFRYSWATINGTLQWKFMHTELIGSTEEIGAASEAGFGTLLVVGLIGAGITKYAGWW